MSDIEEEDIDFYFSAGPPDNKPSLVQYWQYILGHNGRFDLVDDFDKAIKDCQITAYYFNNYLNDFDQKLKHAIDKDFLINAELELFSSYTDSEKLKKKYDDICFIARGYFWALTGKIYTIRDFFWQIGDTKNGIHLLRGCDYILREDEILEIATCIDRAALGYSRALYVKFLKEKKGSNNLDVPVKQSEEKSEKGLPMRARILLLYELGFFDTPKTENKVETKIASVISALIDKNAQNIREAIGQRRLLRGQLKSEGKDSQEALNSVDELLALLNPGK